MLVCKSVKINQREYMRVSMYMCIQVVHTKLNNLKLQPSLAIKLSYRSRNDRT